MQHLAPQTPLFKLYHRFLKYFLHICLPFKAIVSTFFYKNRNPKITPSERKARKRDSGHLVPVKPFSPCYLKVYEMAVHQPSEPQNLAFDGKLKFSSPLYNGGSRISEYEVIIGGFLLIIPLLAVIMVTYFTV